MEFDSSLFKTLLETLISNNPGVLAAAIVTSEGLPIISIYHENVAEARFAALSATLHSVSNIYLNDMQKGEFQHFIIQSSLGYLILVALDDENLIIVSTDENVRLGLIFLSIRDIFSATGGFGKVAQDVLLKVFSIMSEKDLLTIKIERDTLTELFDEKALITDKQDGLPNIKPAVLLYCKSKGAIIEVKGNVVEIERVY
jgi:predicted regulator of Ras-like GTPase activity (Roadblock/LC7/MglB family)